MGGQGVLAGGALDIQEKMIKAEPKISPYWSHESDPDLSSSTAESLSSFGWDPRDPGESDRMAQHG